MRYYPACFVVLAALLAGCRPKPEQQANQPSAEEARATAVERAPTVGGRQTVVLSVPASPDRSKPHLLSAVVLPGRGMTVYQIRAFVPGKGDVDVMASAPLEQMAPQMTGEGDDQAGNLSFKGGGAILLPYANRIRGKLSPDKRTESVDVAGKRMTLVANWKGKRPGAEPHAMHGLILARAADDVKTDATGNEASVSATYHLGDFNGHWLSQTDSTVRVLLRPDALQLQVDAKNVGNADLPIGIGWHPYFNVLSGNREQVKLHIPAADWAQVNNYDDVFPTGKLLPTEGSKYDFNAANGAPLDHLFLDDCFVHLKADPEAHVSVTMADPAAKYGVRVKALTAAITAFQVYAPLDKQFVVIEPQFNWGDPFGKEWRGKNTGMVMLKPGQSVSYAAEVSLFVP